MRYLNVIIAVGLMGHLANSTKDTMPRDLSSQITIDTDFEGGSARVIALDQSSVSVRIMPGGDPERGWPAWWCFRVKGLAKGQLFKVSVVPSTSILPFGRPGGGRPLSRRWAMPDRAAWSADSEHWKQTPPGRQDDDGITYELTATGEDMWVAWGPLVTPAVTNGWLKVVAAKHECAGMFELSKTREGRTIRGIRIVSGDSPVETRPVVWLQARQHAWESGSSWVARGIIEWVTGDSVDAVWLRQNMLTFIVPIMDVDRVVTGDGGKESTPHDHNRDWSDQPHYPEVAAVQRRISTWSAQDRMPVFIDLHNPGPNDREAYYYVPPDEATDDFRKLRLNLFLDEINSAWDAPIPFDRTTRSTGPSYHPLWQQISTTWVIQHSNIKTVSACLETAWNTPGSTTEGYHQVGVSVGTGVSRFLQLDNIQAGR
jgi:hypothetical protein